jgi:hypothetical protein
MKSKKSTSPNTETPQPKKTRKKSVKKEEIGGFKYTPQTAPLLKELEGELKGIESDGIAFMEARQECLEEILRPTPEMIKAATAVVKAGREFISTAAAAYKAGASVITNAKNSVGALIGSPKGPPSDLN